MRKMSFGAQVLAVAVAGVICMGMAFDASAQEQRNRDAEFAAYPMGQKFVRGVTNIATGWVELVPRQFIRAYDYDGALLCAPYGLVNGVFMTVVRTGAGVFETLTFMVPVDGTYDAIIDPAYVWQPEAVQK